MADPIGPLDEIHRVPRADGTAMVLLPVTRRMFDRSRPVTELDHLVSEHHVRVQQVDDEHISELLELTEPRHQKLVVDADPAELKHLFDTHRDRSIDVQCWSEVDFLPVIDHTIGALG